MRRWPARPAEWPSRAVAGPVAAAVGVAVGAVAGGYAGKGIGEMIDPTTEDTWLRDHFKSRPYVAKGDKYEDFHPAYRYGALAEAKYGDAGIDLMDQQLQSDWEASKENTMPWTKAKGAVKDAYDRTVQIRRERECHRPRDARSGRLKRGTAGCSILLKWARGALYFVK